MAYGIDNIAPVKPTDLVAADVLDDDGSGGISIEWEASIDESAVEGGADDIIGYYVVWSVTPALHSPLMAVTNAISSVIIVGALLAAGPYILSLSKVFGLIAVLLASVNIFGGFIVTYRMLSMFKQKTIKKKKNT